MGGRPFGAMMCAQMEVRPLDETTWPDFAALVERHNGVWGGCWCMGFHAEGVGRHKSPALNRAEKEARVQRAGRTPRSSTTATPASAGASSGRPRSCRASSTGARTSASSTALPDWRITCFFVDKAHRRSGVAAAALAGALDEIARLGGGTVESYPENSEGRSPSSSFLHNGTVSMFERQGFERTRQLGKHHWVVAKELPARPRR